jgi:integrase
MASLHRQPGKPFWFCAFTDQDGNRKFKSSKTTNRKQAERICAAWQKTATEARMQRLTPERARQVIEEGVREIADLSGVVMPRQSIRAYFETWLKGKVASEGTMKRYEGIVAAFLKLIGSKAKNSLQSLTDADIQNFRDDLESRVASGTVNTYLKVIRVALNKAVKRNLIDRNPASGVDNLDTDDRHRRRPFTKEELQKLLSVCSEDWRTMVLVGLYTGLRLGDCAALAWANLDLQRNEITVRTEKTGRVQILPIHNVLRAHLMTLPAGDDPTMKICPALAVKDGSQLSNEFYDAMSSVGLVSGRDHVGTGKGRDRRRKQSVVSFHSLRYTATSLLKNAGVSDVVARDIIGHESEAVSRNYTRIDEETKRKAIDSMPDVFAVQKNSA